MFNWFENRIDPYPKDNQTPPNSSLFAFIWACLDGMRGWVVAMVLLTALIGAFEAYLFNMMGKVVDWLASASPATLWTSHASEITLMLTIVVISPLVVLLQSTIKLQTLQGAFPMRLRWNFHRLMLDQSMGFYQDEFAGRVSAKVMQTALAVRDSVMNVSDMAVYVLIYLLTSAAILGSFVAWLIVPFALWMVTFFSSLFYFIPRLGKTAQAQADARSLMTGRVTDAYSNIATVKLFSHGRREAAYAKSAMREFMTTVHQQMRLVTQLETTNHALNMILIAGTVGLSLWLWSGAHIGVGAVAAATAMALRLNGLSHWIMWESASLLENIGTVQDGMSTLSKTHAIVDANDAKELQVTTGHVEFKNVSFHYGENKNLLENLSLSIKAGEKIGLVGRSGAGKSTIVNLLLRFYDVQSGQILIDSQDIRHVTQNSLRAQIGMVTQDTSLLHRSVRDNLTYGRPDASEADMRLAAKRAEALEFIELLSDARGRMGFDAHVGERGVKLSGGQRQRIAIARVMLKDAPILLLDEATSALDSEVESAIQASLYELMEGKTVIAIAHRLSTIAAMDRLIVLDDGKIIEQGSHAELLAKNGLYARLWMHQSGGFLGEE